MITTLRVLRNVLVPEPPQPAHRELEHAHWDREARTWRTHEEPEEEPAQVAS
ncbi:MAG TPA: hypothetical protein VIO84_14290 [Candidatus Dormibacteraeota bacterium]|jgi:hypothetical protein